VNFPAIYLLHGRGGSPNNFAVFRPKKNSFRAEIHLKASPEIDQQLEEAGIDAMDNDKRFGYYRLRITKAEIKMHADLLLKLLRLSYGLDADGGMAMKAKA
jgi:hypothetical protein